MNTKYQICMRTCGAVLTNDDLYGSQLSRKVFCCDSVKDDFGGLGFGRSSRGIWSLSIATTRDFKDDSSLLDGAVIHSVFEAGTSVNPMLCNSSSAAETFEIFP